MKTIIRTKLLDYNHIELRSYELGEDIKLINCVDLNYKKHDHLGEDYMVLKVKDQKKGVVINTQISKFYPYKSYLMYRFLFKPKILKTVQIKEVKFVGNTAII